jgi:uncharacterized glyoxalase superfamily protein PhnB
MNPGPQSARDSTELTSSSDGDPNYPETAGVYPCLTYRDVRGAITWLQTAFGLHGEGLAPPGTADDTPLDHALLRTPGGGTILVESERPDELHGAHAGHGWIYVTVSDADAHYQRAQAAGVRDLGEPHDFGDGFRGYTATDLEQNLWTFGTAAP